MVWLIPCLHNNSRAMKSATGELGKRGLLNFRWNDLRGMLRELGRRKNALKPGADANTLHKEFRKYYDTHDVDRIRVACDQITVWDAFQKHLSLTPVGYKAMEDLIFELKGGGHA